MISPHKISSRDTFVLLTAQLILLIGAIIGWARNYLLGTTRWTRLFDSAHAAGIALVGVVLLWTAIRLLRKRPGLPESWLPVIHHRWLLGASLAGLLLVVTGNALFNTSRLAPALSVLTALFGALILLQSAYDRAELDIPAILMTVGWAGSGLIAISTLRALVAPDLRYIDVYRLKTPLDAPYVPAARLITSALLVILIAGPLAWAALPGLSRRLKAGIARWPFWVFWLAPGAALLIQGVVWLAGRPESLRLLNWLALIVALPGTVLLAFRSPDGDAHPTIELTERGARRALLGLLVVYALISVPVTISWIDQYSGDAFSYLQMARNLAAGQSAVRGLWAPLSAWVFVPGFWLGINPMIVQRALVAILGLVFIVGLFRLARHFDLPPAFGWAVAAAGAIFVVRFAYWPPGGDFISAVLLLLYFNIILGQGWHDHPVRYGLLAGAVATIGYYARSFNLPFVLAHLILTVVVFAIYRRENLRPLLITATVTALILIGGVVPWIRAIHARYNLATFNITSYYTNAYVQHDYHTFCYYDRLCDQPADILFPWEDPDPSQYLPLVVSPIASLDSVAGQIEILFVDMRLWISNLHHNLGLLTVLGLVGIYVVLLADWQNEDLQRNLLWMLLTMALYDGGYWLYIAGEFRFYYPLIPFVLISLFLPLARLAAGWWIPRQAAPVLAAVLILIPLISQEARRPAYTPHPRLFQAPDRCLETDGARLRQELIEPIVGSDFGIDDISYATQLRSYGALVPAVDPATIHQQLVEFGVGSYVVSASKSELIDTLVEEYGYRATTERFCGSPLVILTVPTEAR